MTLLRESAQRVQAILDTFHLNLKVIEFNQLTRTSQEAADTIGCALGQITKTLIFKGKTTGKPIGVIASGKNRIDEKKVAALVGEQIERPDADYVLEKTGFTIGGIPPVGYQLDKPYLIDEDLMEYQEIWAAAGTPYAVFCIRPQDLLKITKGRLANIKK